MSATETIFQLSLLVSALLCTLVFGFMLIFVIVVMPGIAELDDGNFLRAFQVIDGVIQKNQPVFVFVWIGSVVALVITTGFGWKELEGARLVILVLSTVAYLIAQVTTFTINVPLNNQVQSLDIANMDTLSKRIERSNFESKWNQWNVFRTVVMGFVSVYLLTLLLITDSTL